MDSATKQKIEGIIGCIETDNPKNDYSLITLLHDGPGGEKQITLGKGLTELSSDDLKKCVALYVSKKGKYSDALAPYVDKIGKHPTLVNDTQFITLLKVSSKEDQLMRDSQDEIFDTLYWNPAFAFFTKNKFTLPMSMLIIYDSYVQSGQVLQFLRNRFPASVPATGGKEKDWILQYTTERNKWMSTHSNAAIRASAYRTRTYLRLIKDGNWDLHGEIKTDNGCTIPA